MAIDALGDESIPDVVARRVAIFSDALPERNGAGAYYEDLVVQLAPYVDRIEIFRPARRRRWLSVAIPMPGDPTQKLILPDVSRLVPGLDRLEPDLIVAVTPGPFGWLGLSCAWAYGTPFLLGFHTQFERLAQLYGSSLAYRLARDFLEGVNAILCRSSDAVLVHNGDLVDTVRKLGASRVEVMGTPIAPAFLEKPVEPIPAPLERVLFAGRLAPEKNLPAVLDAARRLPDLEFTIAGDGPLRGEIERRARLLPNVRTTGWIDRDALRHEMDAASLLLLPSHLETFGTVALEAMARGRPALVSAEAGIHDWAQLAGALFVLEPGVSLAAALHRLRGLPPVEWRRRSVAARMAAESFHRGTIQQWVACIDRYARS